MADAWPKLSQDLPGPCHPDYCQRCGVHTEQSNTDLTRWQECDTGDQPTPAVVNLCLKCADDVIQKHPRLYVELDELAPHPGTMRLCAPCPHRAGMGCTHPDLRENGGPGLAIIIPPPFQGFIDGTAGPKGGRRTGAPFVLYTGPVRGCAGLPPDDTESKE